MAEPPTQKNSPLRFKAADLGDDDLLVVGMTGREGLSELFRFEIALLAPLDKPVAFEDVLGKPAVVALDIEGGEARFFQGVVSRFGQGSRDDEFISYRATLVPHVWFLTRRVQSRIFQHLSVPQILEKVFDGLPVAFDLQGTFHARDYCAQYRESDFDFAARLMEEEGIYYYFRHTDAAGEMVVANTPPSHDEVPAPGTVIYDEVEGGVRDEGRVTGWHKVQEVRPGVVSMRDHHFELPGDPLAADQKIQEGVAAGQVNHKLNLPPADGLEVYDYPGGYAGRFDGIDRGGAEQPAELEKIFEDNRRTVKLRMQEAAVGTLTVEGRSSCRQFTGGHKFTLERHFDADGDYVLTRVEHTATLGNAYRSAGGTNFSYSNEFRCLPFELPFRPARETPRPTVKGSQTATVVGPDGEEIFTDKYGRIKVQFHWDREGKFDADSSCWLRVATIWAGTGWGVVHLPRIGQEVVVDFLEGDPDQPIVVGSVYNAAHMPPYELPANRTQSGIKSRSSQKGTPQNYNEIMFEDKKGQELVRIHAERNMSTTVEVNNTTTVGNNNTVTIGTDKKADPHKAGLSTTTIFGDTSFTVTDGDYTFTIAAGKAAYTVKGPVTRTYHNTETTTVTADVTENYKANHTTTVKDNQYTHVTAGHHLVKVDAGHASLHVDAGNRYVNVGAGFYHLTAATKITLVTGSSSLEMLSDGTITLKGVKILIDGSSTATMQSADASVSGKAKASLGVGSQSVACDTAKTVVAGTMIKASASGIHEITGAMVKIN